MRVLFAVALLLALSAGAPLAHAGRGLTPAQAAEVVVIARRVQAQRQAREDRRRADADKKKRTRQAKMIAALRLGAEIKAERARKKEAREEVREQETARKNAARLRFLEELLSTRSPRR